MTNILLGWPSPEEGSKAKLIGQGFEIPHISSGEGLPDAISKKDGLGHQAKAFRHNSELVPNHLITRLVCQRIKAQDCEDGYPRTLPQVRVLKEVSCLLV